jgi:hypothetical protein
MTEMREKIARALARRVGTEDSWQCWTNEADAVLALIAPVMEENERWKLACGEARNTLDRIIGVVNRSDISPKGRLASIESIARAALSPKSEKQDG